MFHFNILTKNYFLGGADWDFRTPDNRVGKIVYLSDAGTIMSSELIMGAFSGAEPGARENTNYYVQTHHGLIFW